MTQLQTHQLQFAYKQNLVVDSVTLDFQPGEMTVLLGANGAGKSTLLHLIVRSLKPQQGKVFIEQVDYANLSRRALAKQVALMLQHENRDSMLTVEEVVSLGRLPSTGWLAPLSEEDHQHIEEALAASSLTALRRRRIDELSGGEWRRMILARAVAQQAPVLLLDEPIAGLDLKYQFEILRYVQQLTKQHQLTTVVTLHDLNLAAMFASKIALMRGGKIIAHGSPDSTLTEDVIEQTFGVKVTVMKHPVYKTPLIVPLFDRGQNVEANPNEA